MVEDFEDPELEALVEEGLAEIAAYADIRVKWPSESSDFTPWLADNIHLLGAALGMRLSDVRREFRIGADRANGPLADARVDGAPDQAGGGILGLSRGGTRVFSRWHGFGSYSGSSRFRGLA